MAEEWARATRGRPLPAPRPALRGGASCGATGRQALLAIWLEMSLEQRAGWPSRVLAPGHRRQSRGGQLPKVQERPEGAWPAGHLLALA